MAFAKLYGIGKDEDQVLVAIDSGNDLKPQVKFSFVPKGLGVCSVGPQWPDNDEGWGKAEAFFESVTEKTARDFVAGVKANLAS